jgi:hypothetical protein
MYLSMGNQVKALAEGRKFQAKFPAAIPRLAETLDALEKAVAAEAGIDMDEAYEKLLKDGDFGAAEKLFESKTRKPSGRTTST